MDQEPDTLARDAEAEVLGLRQSVADLLNANRLLVARNTCAEGRAKFPDDPGLATLAGYIHLIIGDMPEAAEAANRAIALGADDPLAWLVLGVTRRADGEHEAAVEALTKAHLGFPERVDAATLLIEETAMAYGVQRGKEAYAEAFARLPNRDITLFWARMLWAVGMHDDMPEGVVSAPLLSVRQWLARSSATPDVEGGPEVIRVQDPPIFGDPPVERPAITVPGYDTYATLIRGATVFAKSSLVLTADGCVLNDTLCDERYGRVLEIPYEAVALERQEDRLLMEVGAYARVDIPGGVMLSGAVSAHFGHWVPEYMCKLAYLERHPRFAGLPIIVDSDMPPQHLEFLNLMADNPVVQIPPGGAFRVGELLVASPPCFFPVHLAAHTQVPAEHQGGLPVGPFRFLQQRVLSRIGEPAARDRKLYLSRKNSVWRRLSNEDEISAALAARGFDEVCLEEMSYPDQVRLFQSASVVVAPNGSSLMNAVYSPPDLKLIVLSQRGLFNWGTFNGCMTELGYRLTFVCGEGVDPDKKHGDYSVPLDLVLAALDGPAPAGLSR